MPDSRQLPDQFVVENLSEPRWEFDCVECDLFDTYGGEDIRQLALDHVRETGHTVAVWSKRWGHLRPAREALNGGEAGA